DLPGHELVVAVVVQLALGRLARSDLDNDVEDFLPRLGNAQFTIDDAAAVDVHVFFQASVHLRIGGQLDAGCRLDTGCRAASAGEADHVVARGHLPRHRHRVIPWAIHEHEAALGDRLAPFVHAVERAGTALRSGAKRFLKYGCQATGL